jgi:phospholipase C
MNARGRRMAALVGATFLILFPATAPIASAASEPIPSTPIQHFVIMMQGDRTFDNYFGTYPGADNIPADTCQEFVSGHPQNGCVRPYVLDAYASASLVAGPGLIDRQWNNGAMDRFVSAFHSQGRDGTAAMGHYDATTLPFYWSAAQNYVLFDRFFSSSRLGERANRDFWVAGGPAPAAAANGSYIQPTIFDSLEAANVSWKFYVQDYDATQTYRSVSSTNSATQPIRVPLLNQDRFLDDPALSSHIVDMSEYYTDLLSGTLPAVAFVASASSSERSASSLQSGQALTKNMVTQLMMSKYWGSSAFMVTYDGPGGWYDHVAPPQVDANGYGLRVPALLISPYVRQGVVNHTVMDSTSALAFIESNWKVAPLAARDAAAISIEAAFDFNSVQRPAVLLPIQAVESPATVDAPSAIYRTYGLAAFIVAVLTLSAAVLPWFRRRVITVTTGRHRKARLKVPSR